MRQSLSKHHCVSHYLQPYTFSRRGRAISNPKIKPAFLSVTMGSTATPEGGANYGRRLIPTLVDEMAASKPDHVYASLPRNKDFTAGFDKVTSLDLARAVNRAAFWIHHEISKNVHFDTVAYLGPSKVYMLQEEY